MSHEKSHLQPSDRCTACGLHPVDHVLAIDDRGTVVAGVMSTPTHFVVCDDVARLRSVERVLAAHVQPEKARRGLEVVR